MVRETIDESILFIGLKSQEKADIVAFGEPMSVKQGTCIVREGELGDALFLLSSGAVEVVTGEGTPEERVLTTLSGGTSLQAGYAGAFFGEMALIDIEPRSATVRAATDVELVRLCARKLREYYAENRDAQLTMITNMARILSRRLRLLSEAR